MNERQFFDWQTLGGGTDVEKLVDVLNQSGAPWCMIGGLAVNHWSKVSIGAISMGQEIGVTPLQAVSLVSTIANDGVYTPPRIVAGTSASGTPSRAIR